MKKRMLVLSALFFALFTLSNHRVSAQGKFSKNTESLESYFLYYHGANAYEHIQKAETVKAILARKNLSMLPSMIGCTAFKRIDRIYGDWEFWPDQWNRLELDGWLDPGLQNYSNSNGGFLQI